MVALILYYLLVLLILKLSYGSSDTKYISFVYVVVAISITIIPIYQL